MEGMSSKDKNQRKYITYISIDITFKMKICYALCYCIII